jgi:serine/threonine-protein kinase
VVLGGRYRIERLLGEGGMGAVYQAEHTHMRKRLAVKVLHPEMSRLPEVVARFEREAMAAAHIEHPNVAGATDFGKLEDGSFFLVLEYVEGQSLREAIGRGRLELGRALHVTRQIASALGRAHALGIVHRDLKPENVMLVRRDGDPDFVKVLDFGIAKVPVGELVGEAKGPGQVLTQLGMVYGTPEYMAPEQALGQPVDARADLYSLGAMAFEMIAGSRPYRHDSKVTLLGMHVTAPIPRMAERAPDAGIPPEVDAIVTRLLAKEAAARFTDAKELVEAIDGVAIQLVACGRIAEAPPAWSMKGGSFARPSFSSGSAILERAGRSLSSGSALSEPAARGPSAPVVRGAAIAEVTPQTIGTGPTSLAEPVTAQPRPASAGSFRGASIAALRTLVRSVTVPAWVTPRVLTIAASGLGGLLVAVVAVVAIASGREGTAEPAQAGASSAISSAAAPVARPPDPKVDEIVTAAQASIDKGDFGAAIDALTAVERNAPDRADLHMLLVKAYSGVRNAPAAMREADAWLAADSRAAADLKLEEEVRNAALLHEAQDEAFALLEEKMGMRGIDILYDIAYGQSGRQYPQAAARARKSLEEPDARKRASPALGILLAFRDAKTCEQKHALLEDVRDRGDARMLPQLQPYEATRGCGFLNHSDCYPCMHRDHALEDAKEAIVERAGQP